MRLPLALILVGALLLVVVNRLSLGWPLYVVGLLAFAVGVGLLVRGEAEEMTRGPEMAIALACLLVIGGAWLLHPQGWQAPGFSVSGTSSHAQLLGRLKTTIVLEDKGMVRGFSTATHQQVWQDPATGPVAMQDRKVLFRDAAHPSLAAAIRPKTGSHFPTAMPWPSTVVATPTGPFVRRGHLWAKLVTAHDIAGDSYTSLVVHGRNGSESTYRVKNVTSLSLRGGVLLLNGPSPRLLLVAKS
jgi:hypothetical protein